MALSASDAALKVQILSERTTDESTSIYADSSI